MDESALARFANHGKGLSLANMEKVCSCIGVRITLQPVTNPSEKSRKGRYTMAHVSTGKMHRSSHFNIGQERKTIWLGKVTKRDEGNWKRHVEELIAAKLQGRSHPYEETSNWLAGLGDSLHKKLVGKLRKDGTYAIGLAVPRVVAPKPKARLLGPFIDGYIAERTDLEASTRLTYANTGAISLSSSASTGPWLRSAWVTPRTFGGGWGDQ